MFQQPHSQSNSPSPPLSAPNQQAASPSNHYPHPSTLTQLSFQQPISTSPIHQTKNKKLKVQWTCWSDDQHIKLAALFRDRGPAWEEIHAHLKKDKLAKLKGISSLVSKNCDNSQPSTPTRQKTLQFRDLKRLIEEIRRHKHKPEATYTRSQSLIGRLMAAQRLQTPNYLTQTDQDLLDLKQLVERAKVILSKKVSEASTALAQKEEVQIQHNRIEQGYQSDSSSVFEQDEQQRNQLPSIEQYREDEAFNLSRENGNREQQQQQERGRVVLVEQDEERIKELLSREGLLQFEVERQASADFNFGEFGGELVEGDVLDNQSYQHFCTNEFIETNKANLREKPGGGRVSAAKTSLTETTTK